MKFLQPVLSIISNLKTKSSPFPHRPFSSISDLEYKNDNSDRIGLLRRGEEDLGNMPTQFSTIRHPLENLRIHLILNPNQQHKKVQSYLLRLSLQNEE
jgi:hypothetical protein